MSKPLAGLVVVDLSRLLPGPFLTKMLSDMGALVIKIEDRHGDWLRHLPPQDPHHKGIGAAYAALNAGKRSVVLDLKKPQGVALFCEIVKRADILVESFRPGVMQRLGLSFDRLEALNPRLIVCSLSGYGQDGALSQRAGHDLNYMARAGVLASRPEVPPLQVADLAGGSLSAAVAILAAVVGRYASGKGCHLDISMMHEVQRLAVMDHADVHAAAASDGSAGVLRGEVPSYRVYGTKDGRFMALAALEPKFFAAFCQVVGCAELTGKGLCRGAQGASVIAQLEAVFAQKTQAEWIDLLQPVDTCCEPVLSFAEALEQAPASYWLKGGLGAAFANDASLPVSSPGADAPEVFEILQIDPHAVDNARAAGALVEIRG